MKQDPNSEQGQVLVVVVLSLVALLGMSALVMDVGFAWYAKRQLQASVDAAALAGAQALPAQAADTGPATTLAQQYLARNNPKSGVTVGTPSITFDKLAGTRNTTQ